MDPIELPPIEVSAPPEVEEEKPIEIAAEPQTPPLGDAVTANRVNKMVIGQPGWQKTPDQLTQAMGQGQEFNLRTEAARVKDAADYQAQEAAVMQVAQSQNRRLTLPEVELIKNMVAKKQQDPNSVFEEGYANTFMENLKATAMQNPTSDMAQAFIQAPKEAEETLQTGKDLKAKVEFMRTLAENAQAATQAQSWTGFGIDAVKSLVPGYTAAKLMDFSQGGSVGTNLDRQAANFYTMPFDQMKEKSQAVYDKMIKDNPQAAAQYFGAMVYQSQSDRVLNNLFPLMDATAALDVVNLGSHAIDKVRLINTARKMVASVAVDQAPKVSRATINEAAGNLREAGIQQATENLVNNTLQPTTAPETAIQQLQTALSNNVGSLVEDPNFIGPSLQRAFSQELTNRIQTDSATMFDKVISAVQHGLKINRLAGMLATDTTIRQVAEDQLKRYGTLDNSLMNHIMKRDDFGNPFIETHISQDGTSLFSSRQLAQNFIKNKGLGDVASAVEAEGPGKMQQVKVAGTGLKVTPPAKGTGNLGRDVRDVFTGELDDRELKAATTGRDAHNKIGPSSDAGTTTFKTAKGSEYEVHPDGTTSRNKSYHPEHGRKDVGPQPKSDKTYYVTLDDAQKLGEFQTQGGAKKVIAEHSSGQIGVKYTEGEGAGKFERKTIVTPKSAPAKGLIPVELWKGGERVHFGNAITDVSHSSGVSTAIHEIDDRIGAAGRTPVQTAEVQQKGAGYYVVIKTPIDETTPLVRSLILTTNESKTPDSMINAFGGYLGSARTPEDTLSVIQSIARKIATFGPSNWNAVIEDNLKEIRNIRGGLPGTEKRAAWQQWQKVMNAAVKVPNAKGEIGEYNFRNVGELAGLYMNNAGRLPTEAEITASFALRREQQTLNALNNIREFKRLHRLGAKSVTFSSLDEAADGAKSTPYRRVQVNAVPVSDLPSGKNSVLVLGDKVGEETMHTAGNLFANAGPGSSKTAMKEAIKNGGLRVYRLPNPELRPFRGFGSVKDEYLQYVVSKSAQEGDISWDHLNVGKVPTYDYDHYVSQAIVTKDRLSDRHIYEGDRTIAAFNRRVMGQDVARRLDEIRLSFKAGNEAAAYRTWKNSGLDQEWSEVKGWFDSGRLNTEEPIQLTPRGKMTHDLNKDMDRKYGGGDKFRDGTRENYGLLVDDRRDPYDVFTYKNEGTKDNPLYKQSPVKHINPLVAMNRAMTKAVNGMFMDDYKVTSIEHWIQEAKDHLNVSDENLASSPAFWFYNAENPSIWKSGGPNANKIRNNLMTANYQIKQFVGISDQTTTWLHSFAQQVSDSLYGLSPGIASRIVPDNVLHGLRDPFTALRSFAFHTKLGLFAVPQLIVQMQQLAMVGGIAGYKYAGPGTQAALFHTWLRMNQNPEILEHLDKLISKNVLPGASQWKAGELMEAHKLLTGSGFENVGTEHIFRDATAYHDFIGTKFQGFLNMGAMFFQEGERMSRTAAFYTAYREMRDLFPTGRMTQELEEKILNRADLLSGNMSRASASALHKGVFSTTSQFLSYQLRTAELVLGKRLTDTERRRLAVTYGTLYGVPGMAGLTGIPAGDMINKWAQENGYVPGPDNNFVKSMVMEGVPATMLAMATGNNYNIQERYSNPGGITPLSDILKGDATFIKIIGGAPLSIMSQALANTDGFWRMMVDHISGEGDFKFKVDDVTDMLNSSAAFSTGSKLYNALTTGRLLSNNEGYLGDVSKANAIFMSLTGLSPKEQASIQTMSWTRNEEKDKQAQAISAYTKEMRRGFQEQSNKNYDQALDYFKRGMNILRASNFPTERYPEAFAIASKGYESIITHANWDYYTRNVPTNRKATALEALPRALKNAQGQ